MEVDKLIHKLTMVLLILAFVFIVVLLLFYWDDAAVPLGWHKDGVLEAPAVKTDAVGMLRDHHRPLT